MAQSISKTVLFEQAPIPRAVAQLAVPTILSSLVMVLYNLADTYFVGMLGNPVQNAAVTLAAPVLLAFNAVNNLFGVGSSSMMSRALGRKDYETVSRSSSFGFCCAVAFGLLFSLGCTVFWGPLMTLLGADSVTWEATAGYLYWTVTLGATPAILNVVMAYLVRAEGSALHASIGTMSGCLLNIVLDPIFILPLGPESGGRGSGMCHISLQLCGLHLFSGAAGGQTGTDLCLYRSQKVHPQKGDCCGGLRCWDSRRHPKSPQCYRHDHFE